MDLREKIKEMIVEQGKDGLRFAKEVITLAEININTTLRIEDLLKLFQSYQASQNKRVVERLQKKLDSETGTVQYTNPDGKKYRVYNADQVDKHVISLISKKGKE